MEISILDFKIEPSKQKAGTDYLTLQIEKGSDEKRVVFTGSSALIHQMKQVNRNDLPFKATIISKDESFELS